MEHETYLERIKKLKSAKKITNEKLAELTGIPLGTLSKLLAGISDSPKLVNMVAISQALGCSLDYLITGEPENTNNYTLEAAEITLVETYRALDDYGKTLTIMVLDKEYERSRNQATEAAIRRHDEARAGGRSLRGRRRAADESAAPTPAVASVLTVEPTTAPNETAAILPMPSVADTSARTPVSRASTGLGRRRVLLYDLPVSAGTGMFLDDLPASGSTGVFWDESVGTEIFIPDAPRTQEADFALRIAGDSMEPKYHAGDVLLVQNCDSVEEGELGIFMLDGNGYFKKYGGDRLISLNPAYPPIMLKDFEETACFGRVVGKLKRK